MSTLHITTEEFYNSTPRQLHYAIQAYNESEENKIKIEYEKTRIQTWRLLQIHVPKNFPFTYDRFCKHYWPFSWEKVLTEDEVERIKRIKTDQSHWEYAKKMLENSKKLR